MHAHVCTLFHFGTCPDSFKDILSCTLIQQYGACPETMRACNLLLSRTCPHNVIKILLTTSRACPYGLVRLYNAGGLPRFLSCLMQLSHIHAYVLCSIQYTFRFHDHAVLVLLATFCWQNHCHVSVLLKQGRRNYSESSEYSEINSLIWKGPYYDKFQYHKL